MTSLLLLASLAQAGALRVTVEVGPDGAIPVAAVEVPGVAATLPGPAAAAVAPLQVRDADGRLLASVPVPDPRLRSVVLPGGRGATTTLERARIRVDVPWPEGADHVVLGGRRLLPRPPPEAGGVKVQDAGPSEDRLDLVFLGDGYTESELADFADDVDRVVEHLLGIEPYGAYSGLFNIWRVDVASAESGLTHTDPPEVERDTAYGCYYGCGGIDRLVCCDDDAVLSTVDAVVPAADGILVLVNDPAYGGSGGFSYATSYVGEPDGVQVAAHELGHSLVGLWDEYGYGVEDQGSGPNCSPSPEGHWEHWLGVEGVSAFAQCSYENLYRPTEQGCMMRTLQDDYCPVCREQAVLAVYSRIPRLVTSVDPPEGSVLSGLSSDEPVPFTVETAGPDEGLVFEWSVDGEVFAEDEPDFDLRCSGANGELTLRVFDPTPWVRSDPEGLLEQTVGPWTVSSEPCADAELPVACGCRTGGATGALLPALLAVLGLRRRRR